MCIPALAVQYAFLLISAMVERWCSCAVLSAVPLCMPLKRSEGLHYLKYKQPPIPAAAFRFDPQTSLVNIFNTRKYTTFTTR